MIINNKEINEEMIYEQLDNGIKCYIIPKPGYVEKVVAVAVNYGSADIKYNKNGKTIDTPQGVAHFLEHKLFEGKHENTFDRFVKLGASVNAFTNYVNTAYHFSCNENLDECVKILLDFTSECYFTDENVEKEKGIIKQEIKMYQDDPFWRGYLNLMGGLYKECPVKYDIAGTPESVDETDKGVLFDCYEDFYVPSNMVFVAAGDGVESIIDTLNNFKGYNKRSGRSVERHYPRESTETQKNVKSKMNVSRDMFNLGFKETSMEGDVLLRNLSQKLFLDYMFGTSSDFYENCYNEGLIDDSFSSEYSGSTFYGMTVFSGNCSEPENLTERILNAVKDLNGLDNERFMTIKRKHIGRFIRGFNYLSGIVNGQIDMFSKGLTIFDFYDKLRHISVEEVYAARKLYTDKNYTLSCVVAK